MTSATAYRRCPSTVGYGVGFGGVVGADVPLVGGVSLQIRSGPISHVFRQALSETGGETGDTLKTPPHGGVRLGLW